MDGETGGVAGARRRWAKGMAWWFQFPAPLRQIATIRLIAMFGAGGVLYLTPIVFHQEAFSASSVTGGLALAALAGTVGRFASGALLDRGLSCSLPILLTVLFSIGGDGLLLGARGFGGYLAGQVLIGIGAGLYWPAIELAVPLSCAPTSSARAFALVRSADALGVAAGALAGALLATLGWLRGIYLIDIACLLALVLLLRRPLAEAQRRRRGSPSGAAQWLPPLLPLLAVVVLATAMPALMQSALPLDLVRGGLRRPPMSDQLGALLVGLQLALLVLLQWPVGQAMARRPVRSGLTLSLLCFLAGNLLLALSALTNLGFVVLLLAQLPLALGAAAFLPTATEAVVELTPREHQGLAMALFSQCFALSAFGAPLLAGRLLDSQGHGVGLWLLMALVCSLGLPLVALIERTQRRSLLRVLQGREQGAEPEILYRVELPAELPSEDPPVPSGPGEP
jgi:MFS family permease